MDTVDSTVASPSGEPRHSHSNKPNEDDHRQCSIHSKSTPNSNAANPMINGWCRLWVSLWGDEDRAMMHKIRSDSIINPSTHIHTLHGTHTRKQSHRELPLVSAKIVEFSNFSFSSETQAWRGTFIRRSRMDRASYWKRSGPWSCGGIMWCVYKRIYGIYWFHDCLCIILWSINCESHHLHLSDVTIVSLSVCTAVILLGYHSRVTLCKMIVSQRVLWSLMCGLGVLRFVERTNVLIRWTNSCNPDSSGILIQPHMQSQ